MIDPQKYLVSAYEPEGAPGTLIFTVVPKGLPQGHGLVEMPKRAPRYIVAIRPGPNGLDFDWGGSPSDPGAAGAEIQTEITIRMNERAVWIGRVNELVSTVEQWAQEFGWATRRIEKKLDDSRVGKHRVPALIMQADTCRIILEPVGRSASGAEGVVDLYLMPAYDDIASIYYYNDRWNLHYSFPGAEAVATVREAEAFVLTKEVLGRVLEEMRRNAV